MLHCMCRLAAELRPGPHRAEEGGAVGVPGQGAEEEGGGAVDVRWLLPIAGMDRLERRR